MLLARRTSPLASIGARVHVVMILFGRDKKWLVEKTRLGWKTIGHLLDIETLTPRPRTIAKVARALGVSPGWLTNGASRRRLTAGERNDVQDLLRQLRAVASGVRLAVPKKADRSRASNVRREARLRVPRQLARLGARHVYRAKGESMTAFGLRDGDLVYARPLTSDNVRGAVGGIVVVELNGILLLKQLAMTNAGGAAPGKEQPAVILRGSPTESPITITAADKCKPLGQVVASMREHVVASDV